MRKKSKEMLNNSNALHQKALTERVKRIQQSTAAGRLALKIQFEQEQKRQLARCFMPFDLFGEIPVTQDELVLWCKLVPKLPADSPRFDWYVKYWNVAQKIQAAKEQCGSLSDYFDHLAIQTRLYA